MATKSVLFEKVSHRYECMPGPLAHNLSITFHAGWTGVVGANGAGKTTLLKLACGLLEPSEGRVQMPGDALYCAQRTDEVPALLDSLVEASDHLASELLGIESDWVRRWESLSHGERKRAHIGVVLWQQPADLPSIECLEKALVDCPCGLLLVSHDERFLRRLTETRWHIAPTPMGPPGRMLLQIL